MWEMRMEHHICEISCQDETSHLLVRQGTIQGDGNANDSFSASFERRVIGKVAKGIEDVPPVARIHRLRAEPDFGTAGRKPSSAAPGDNAEASIRALVMATLEEQGKIDPDGKLAVSEEEVRRMVREHIDQWMAQQMSAGD